MKEFLADLHIHSRFSIACSKTINPESLAYWAGLKGLEVIGTGDFTHPGWLSELEDELVEDGSGLLRLKSNLAGQVSKRLPATCQGDVRFLLSTEISTIYKRGGKTRKVHHVICVPDFESAHRLSERLSEIGNIHSNGRPILGLDSRKLLEFILELGGGSFLFPAHIWTPWFSVLGQKSGFDSIDECYGDLSREIFAVETGLSSDPPMNWRLSALDRFVLVSNSDAHSPQKLGRECNVFLCEKTFSGIRNSLKTGKGFLGTVEFFPEEGKYHYDGHRKCQKRMSPEDTLLHSGKCPVCGKPVTVGVMSRVTDLSDRKKGYKPSGVKEFKSLTGLQNILSELLGVGPSTRKVEKNYFPLLEKFGPELYILMTVQEETLRDAGTPGFADAIGRMRKGKININPGYDGEFGKIKLLP